MPDRRRKNGLNDPGNPMAELAHAGHLNPHRHGVGARQCPLATARLAPDDQPVIAETAPGRKISQGTSAYAG